MYSYNNIRVVTSAFQNWIDSYWKKEIDRDSILMLYYTLKEAVQEYKSCCNPGIYASLDIYLSKLKRLADRDVNSFVKEFPSDIMHFNELFRNIHCDPTLDIYMNI